MSSIVIIGGGVMASAFAIAQADEHQVAIIPSPFDQKVVDQIQATGRDERLDVAWPNIQFGQTDEPVDLIVMGVSSAGISWGLEVAQSLLKKGQVPVVLLTKGLIESKDVLVPLSEYAETILSTDVLAITGPCIAKELAEKRSTHIELSGRDQTTVSRIRKLLEKSYYHVHEHRDYIGCQWSAALKNVYAILISQSGNLNMHSATFAEALKEMSSWIESHGGAADTVYGLSGVGDLYVTSLGGRNGRLGSYLAKGMSLSEILEGPMQGVTVEGLDLAYDLVKLKAAKDKQLFQKLAKIL